MWTTTLVSVIEITLLVEIILMLFNFSSFSFKYHEIMFFYHYSSLLIIREKREILKKCGATSLNSKLLANYRDFFSVMVVSAVEKLDTDLLDKDLIGVKLVTGGSITDSFLVDGVAFKKTFSYAGFEKAPKKFSDPKICLLNIELEKKAEKENAEIRIENPEVYQSLIDAEWDKMREQKKQPS